jgi:hypothetical protein
VRVPFIQLVGLGEGEVDCDAVPRADTLAEGVMDADRQRVAEEEGERVPRPDAVAQGKGDNVDEGVNGPAAVSV